MHLQLPSPPEGNNLADPLGKGLGFDKQLTTLRAMKQYAFKTKALTLRLFVI
jgi:hypothetical protein